MKNILALAAMAGLMASPLQAAVLGKFDFNNLTSVSSSNQPSYISPCVDLTELDVCCLTEGLRTAGGFDGSAFRTYSGWSRSFTDFDMYLNRDAQWQWPKTLSFDVQASANSLGTVTGLGVQVSRPYNNSPDTIMAAIFWQDDAGIIQQRNSGPLTIASSGWNEILFDFDQGSAAFPVGSDFSGEMFNVEIYAWGGEGGALYIDDITLYGSCAPVPEPGGALLIGMAGLTLLLRRRLR